MTPVDAFGVVVRSVGLVMAVTAGWTIVLSGLNGRLGPVIAAIIPLSIGLWLLRGAAAVVYFAYPEHAPQTRRREKPIPLSRRSEPEFDVPGAE